LGTVRAETARDYRSNSVGFPALLSQGWGNSSDGFARESEVSINSKPSARRQRSQFVLKTPSLIPSLIEPY
jgi:hypothetical protein